MPAKDGRHRCPGCHTVRVPASRLACTACWYRLPESLRNEVWRSWRVRYTDRFAHLQVIAKAITWYNSHPLPAPTENQQVGRWYKRGSVVRPVTSYGPPLDERAHP